MCDQEKNTCENCLSDILEVIIKLQRRGQKFDDIKEGCDKPFLGPCPSICTYNTRPIRLFRCCDGGLWTLPYGTDGLTSSVFRAENLDGCCLTCRILAPSTTGSTEPYVATNQFFTINLNCVGALECLADTYVDVCS